MCMPVIVFGTWSSVLKFLASFSLVSKPFHFLGDHGENKDKKQWFFLFRRRGREGEGHGRVGTAFVHFVF